MNITELTAFVMLFALLGVIAMVLCDDDNDPRFP
jgi:hypothetical protein